MAAAFDIKGRDALSATATGGAAYGGTWSQGGFAPNVSGSAPSIQSGGLSPLLVAVAAVCAAWLLLRKRD